MPTTLLRLISLLALGGQLLPLGLPFACPLVRRAAGACEQSMASRTSIAAVDTQTAEGTAGQAPCVNSAFCAVVATAIPVVHRTSLLLAAVYAAPVADIAALNPSDPLAPLSPPPQA